MKNKPYIVSADIYLLLKKWAKQKNLVLPEEEFFEKLRKEFSTYMLSIFPSFEFISEEEILRHMTEVTSKSNLHCVTLDPIYFPCYFSIELTRNVDLEGRDLGLQPRFNSDSLFKQLNHLKSHGIIEVCLVDDVIFSGAFIARAIKLLSSIGINVTVVCAGIGIQEGISRIIDSKRKIYCAKIYNEVIDEVCERDFYLGIPYSGRSLAGNENIGLPYILPYGRPDEWASIPIEIQLGFSEFCINQSIILFEEIQKKSNRKICCSDIERKVPQQPKIGSYVDFLKSIRNKQLILF